MATEFWLKDCEAREFEQKQRQLECLPSDQVLLIGNILKQNASNHINNELSSSVYIMQYDPFYMQKFF